MQTTLLRTTCPFCCHPFTITDDEVVANDLLLEVACPLCDEEFVVDDDGEALGGAPGSAPFAINEDGELIVAEDLTVICPRCSCVQTIDEPGVVPCRRCRRRMTVDADGYVAAR
jgi:hypothetical protein